MAEGLNTPQSAAEQEGNGEHLPNGNVEVMEVDTIGDAGDAAAGAGDNTTNEERKLTQTDHINKSLLTSFLNHLNNPAMAAQFPILQVNEDEEEDEDDSRNA